MENLYKQYRARLNNLQENRQPCIPLHSLLLHDLSMIEEMDDVEDGLVNWQKMQILGESK